MFALLELIFKLGTRGTKEQKTLKGTTGCKYRVEMWLECGVVREGFNVVVSLELRSVGQAGANL